MRFWNPSCRYWKSKNCEIFSHFSTAVLVRHTDRVIGWSTFVLLRIPEWRSIIFSRKVNRFLNNMNPTEAQIASYIDNLREKQWPEGLPVMTCPIPHRSSEEKHETKDRAHHLINARCTWYTVFCVFYFFLSKCLEFCFSCLDRNLRSFSQFTNNMISF